MSDQPAKKNEAWELLFKEDHKFMQSQSRHDDGYCVLCGRSEEAHTNKDK